MSKECYTRYEVERQNWVRWPRVLVVTELSPQGTAQRRYVPEDSEEIVRCRECEYRADRGSRHYCDAHGGGFFEVAADDFCSWGERKTDA